MKTSNAFKQVIENRLNEIAANDSLFAVSFAKENKNIEDCIKYILNTVQKSGINGFTDDEIYNMAIHYYDEDNINVGGDINCQVVVNHTVELTEEEKQEAKQKAIDAEIAEQRSKLRKKPAISTQKQTVTEQTLF